MSSNANIEFIVDKHLSIDECDRILNIIETIAPGIRDQLLKNPSDGTSVQRINMQQYRTKTGKLLYRIPLHRNMLSNEAMNVQEQVANYLGKKPGMKYTTLDSYKNHIKEDPVDFEEMAILASAAQKRHDRWVHEMTNNGWRYGVTENHYEKTHPLLRPWSSLPTETLRKDISEVKLIRKG